MSGRRNLVVRYGTEPPAFVTHETNVGVGWSRTGLGSDVLHLTPFEPWATTALCGVAASDPTSLAGGRLCRKCADIAELRSTDDLPFEHSGLTARVVDEPSHAAAQHYVEDETVLDEPERDEPAPSRVEQLLDSLDESVAAARAAKQERNDFAARVALELIESADRMLETEAAEWAHVVLVLDPEVAASPHGGLGECVTGARGPYSTAAEAWIAAAAVRDDLSQHDAEPWVVVAVPLMTTAGAPWTHAHVGVGVFGEAVATLRAKP